MVVYKLKHKVKKINPSKKISGSFEQALKGNYIRIFLLMTTTTTYSL